LPGNAIMASKAGRLSWAGLFCSGILVLLMGITCLRRDRNDLVIPYLEGLPTARVLLKTSDSVIKLWLPAGSRIENNKLLYTAPRNVVVSIRPAKGMLHLVQDSGHLGKQPVRIQSERLVFIPGNQDDILSLDGAAYRGELVVTCPALDKLRVINHVNLEYYLYGVVTSEMPSYWGDEALNAQAVAARSYALYHMRTRKSKAYDLMPNQASQVYKGVPGETPKSIMAVNRTRGMIVTYQSRLFPTYYHSSCGGATDAAEVIFGQWNLLPLSGVTCGFCSQVKDAQWQVMAKTQDLVERLSTTDKPLIPPIRLEIVETGKGGHAAWIRIHYRGGMRMITADKVRSRLRLKSTCFTLIPVKDGVLFKGKGRGHGIGMCQTGAGEMAKRGYNCLQILRTYYPGNDLVRFY